LERDCLHTVHASQHNQQQNARLEGDSNNAEPVKLAK